MERGSEMVTADVAIIGGSGLYSLFAPGTDTHLQTVRLATQWGEPSAPIEIAQVGTKRVAFLPRHGADHQYPPHSIPYRANIAALADLGVKQIIAPCASGSLRESTPPGTLVVPDQLVDQTHSRPQTFHDAFGSETHHAQFAEPFCAQLRESLLRTSGDFGWQAADEATIVVIEGPSFSTRAEVEFYARQGWGLVNMTAAPESVLAREVGICYATLALVTNFSANLISGAGVSEHHVFEFFAKNTERLRELLMVAIADLPEPTADGCVGSHSGD
jgi:5'-methylthioadenosine phosphorylase